MRTVVTTLAAAIAVFSLTCGRAPYKPSLEAGDWPQFRADAGRTGYTPAELPDGLSLRWKRENPAPMPAWKGVHTRMTFDYAYQPVIADGVLYYGSSADCTVYAVDAGSGEERWSFHTGAPVRFAPAAWNGRVFVGGDDGWIYCLDARSGSVEWKKRGGPGDGGMILGNDRMISRRPVRGGIAIVGDVLYVGAGIWPSEGIYIRALDPATGDELWVNDDAGGMEYDQPHGGARAKSGISSQGYLVAAGGSLLVPTGRSVPAALDIETGAFKYFHLQKHRAYGGSRVVAAGDFFFATSGNTRFDWEIIGRSNAVFSAADGELAVPDEFNSPGVAVSPDYIFSVDSSDRHLKAYQRDNFVAIKKVPDGMGGQVETARLAEPAWAIDTREPECISMIAAADRIVTGSVNGRVTVLDAGEKAVVESFEVDGVPYGLAAADGKLFVSTDRGTIYCFDGDGVRNPGVIAPQRDNFPYGANDEYAEAAREIVASTGVTEGYCLDLGCGDGRLACELAKLTNLTIIAVDADGRNVETARRKLAAAGLYGTRVVVHRGDPAKTDYPAYFANLVVSGRSVTDGEAAVSRDEAFRLQRPYGGALCVGKPGAMKTTVRGELPGAGRWTHLYSDPGNTINSGDELVTAPLGMLWFRDSDFEMPSRHGRGVGPLYRDGRLFVQGNHGIRAYDAYNGRVLWEFFIENLQKAYDQEHLLGAATTHGNWCIEGDRLYVRVSEQMAGDTFRNCLVIDAKNGNLLDRFRIPPGPDGDERGYWGYLAVDDGILFGSVANDEHITKWGYLESNMSALFSESKALFALDAETGEMKWMYEAEHSIRHNAVAIGNGRVYLVDRPIARQDYLFYGGGRSRGGYIDPAGHRQGKLVALDAETGKVLKVNRDSIYGTLLALDTESDVLVMTYQYTRFKLPSEVGGRMAGFRASDLSRLWDVETGIGPGGGYGYSSRPIINRGTVYFEPYAFDILTGNKLDFTMSRTYNCGIIAGAENMLVYRSGTIGYLDLTDPGAGTVDFGGIRPGCWINAIPAGGLVLMPDATARCNCSYLIKSTIALSPM